jgi:hypothetical protein
LLKGDIHQSRAVHSTSIGASVFIAGAGKGFGVAYYFGDSF